ncbi:hypothetical protein, partial [Mesorhizobium sp. M2E.F.Ca.ET.166.01.1.1]|uniref:hypothetical protein n=1 Tax=Mesorhizobium sp. M2E.F.Ca.ET.166.01.1.1 TaxID=2500523 RepID=UPI001093845D
MGLSPIKFGEPRKTAASFGFRSRGRDERKGLLNLACLGQKLRQHAVVDRIVFRRLEFAVDGKTLLDLVPALLYPSRISFAPAFEDLRQGGKGG